MPDLFASLLNLIAVADNSIQSTLLYVGVVIFAGGLALLWHHRNEYNRTFEGDGANANVEFDRRKFSRRSTVGALVACCGVVMGSFYWVEAGATDGDKSAFAFSVLLGLLLLLVLVILILAMIDMLSIGIKVSVDQMAENDRETSRAIDEAIKKYKEDKAEGDEYSASPRFEM